MAVDYLKVRYVYVLSATPVTCQIALRTVFAVNLLVVEHLTQKYSKCVSYKWQIEFLY